MSVLESKTKTYRPLSNSHPHLETAKIMKIIFRQGKLHVYFMKEYLDVLLMSFKVFNIPYNSTCIKAICKNGMVAHCYLNTQDDINCNVRPKSGVCNDVCLFSPCIMLFFLLASTSYSVKTSLFDI